MIWDEGRFKIQYLLPKCEERTQEFVHVLLNSTIGKRVLGVAVTGTILPEGAAQD
jgi:hypothetical protein